MRQFSDITPAASRVVDAAEALIALHGYNGFSYDDIARAIGIKKPSIHHHFATKSELVRIVVQRYAHRFGAALAALDAAHADAPARLSAYAALFAHTYRRDRRLCVCGILGAEAESLAPDVCLEVGAFFQMNLDWLARSIAQGQRDATLTARLTPAEHATTLLAVLQGAMLLGRGLGNDVSPAVAADNYIDGLRAP